jgi:hypothetical protein
VTGFPGPRVLRRLRHDPTPTADVAPARRPAGCGMVRATSGRFPRSLMFALTGPVPSYTPTASPTPHIAVSGKASDRPWDTDDQRGRSHRIRLPPAPRRDPSTRFDRSLTTHGASTTDSVSLHLPVVVCGHVPSGGTGTPLRCQGCSQPYPRPGDRPALNFNQPLQ